MRLFSKNVSTFKHCHLRYVLFQIHFSKQENEVLPVLPVQEDEWEFSGAEQQQREKIYPALEQEDSAVVSANLVSSKLGAFYFFKTELFCFL